MISAAERQERLEAVGNVIGTQRAEGICLDAPITALLNRFIEGELTLDQVSTALDEHATRPAELANVA